MIKSRLILYGSLIFNILFILFFIALLWKNNEDNSTFISGRSDYFDQYKYFFVDNNRINFISQKMSGSYSEASEKGIYAIANMGDLDQFISKHALDSLMYSYTNGILFLEQANLEKYDPDYVFTLLEWADQFKFWSKISSEHQFLFEAISSYWYNEIALLLSQESEADPKVRNSYKFRFLSERCNQNNYHVNIPETKIEKVQKNFLRGNWNHLISATWNDTSIGQKVLLLLLGLLTFLAYLNLFLNFIKRK